ncbi:hypothetical protein HYALB_00002125 [Hymenoscyphus albidus]|uniref:Amidase domain-containing protein n=1 Tax=Hymenoscyphus albidus TaxID=595503 RepID=A0A9N9LJJ1_9HELO|nr:hypothetical protein HYALB_00002125 [Hymenoscyphus albidus]
MSQPTEPTDATARRYFGYPKALEGPRVPFRMDDGANPGLSGIPLVIAGWLVSKVGFLQRFIYNNAGLNCLRKLDLKGYSERWEKEYVPNLELLSFQTFPENLPGRYNTVADYHATYLSGELTPLAVCESLLPLIRRDVDSPSSHSVPFVATDVSAILLAARESTARYAANKSLGLLDGIPTAVKDSSSVAGYRSTIGQAVNDELFPVSKTTTWSIQKLQECGAIVLGKTNMHDWGTDITGCNPNWGTVRNPYNSQYYAGGSSGGSAYAVAAGLIPFALGADGGGSIRIPCAFCGVYGLKPTHGRIDNTKSTAIVIGPIAGTMTDLEAMYRVMAQPNPLDPTCGQFAPPGALPPSRTKIIGICKPWFARAESSVLNLCQQAVDYYQNKLGYEVVEIEIPYLAEGQKAHAFTILSELAIRARAQHLPNQIHTSTSWLSGLNAANKFVLSVGAQTKAQDYLLAQQLRNLLMQYLAFLYKKHPGMIIVTPTTPMPGWNIKSEGDLKYGSSDGNSTLRGMEYIWLANFCGTPALSSPIGYVDPIPTAGEGKIPVSLMGMGDWGSENQLCDWGREAEIYLSQVTRVGEGDQMMKAGLMFLSLLGVRRNCKVAKRRDIECRWVAA